MIFLFTFFEFFFILIRHASAVRLQSVTHGWLSSLYGHANLGKILNHECVFNLGQREYKAWRRRDVAPPLDQARPQTHHTCRSKFNSFPSSMIAARRQAQRTKLLGGAVCVEAHLRDDTKNCGYWIEMKLVGRV